MDTFLELIRLLKSQTSLDIPETLSQAELRELLAVQIRRLIHQDFPRLVTILYRVDISEKKLALLLKSSPEEDAGFLIAGLLIERQKEKMKSRQHHAGNPPDSGEESW